ncbi:MAG: peptidoglycan-associated lipoprotein Pal [Pseudomonadota bacterium]
MHKLMKCGAAAAVLIGLGACASTPVEEPQVEEVAEVVTPEPVRPAPPPVETQPLNQGPAAGTIEDFRVNVGERVYFDLDQWRLDDTDKAILQRQAAWLQSYPSVRILVAGNCDERGTREYNLALGERRASIVRDYLVGLGVDGARVETVSYGKERPIDGGSNDAAWALNRNGFTQIVSGARTS